MKTASVLVVVICSALNLKAQTFNNSDTQKIVDQFFRVYENEGHVKAVDALLATNKWISDKSAENVSTKLTDVVNQIGKYYGYEKIKESKYGNSVIQYAYLVRYERQPLRFLFRFYRPNDEWQTQGFEYEVDFIDELDEASKAYRLKENQDN